MASPYESLISQLLLPSTIFDLIDPPLKELGYPLKKGSADDMDSNPLDYWAAQSNDEQIVLLHVPGDIINNLENWPNITAVAHVFLGKPRAERTTGLFFFASIKELPRRYNTLVAPTLERDYPKTKRVKFFDQKDMEDLGASPGPKRTRLVNYLLDVDKILPPPNGNTKVFPPLPPDLLTIQDKVADFVFNHYSTQPAVDTKQFFLQLRLSLKWPPEWIWEPQGNAKSDALALVVYLVKQRNYPAVSNLAGYTTLGVLLEQLMPQVGGTTAKEMYDLIVQYQLIEKQDILDDLKNKFYGAGG
jgi:hypothetical protein